jgi:sulfite reductase (NADPH) hemoprotein beta-component
VDKDGAEFYQVSLGGADGSDAGHGRVGIGKIIGPSFAADDIPGVVEQLLDVFVTERDDGERFAEVVARIGVEPFKQAVYARRRDDEALKEAA